MSIAMAVIGKDGIVLATDSKRADDRRLGYHIGRKTNVKKLWQIGDSVGLISVGDLGEQMSQAIELFIAKKPYRNSSFEDVSHAFAQWIVKDISSYLTKDIRDMEAQIVFIMCGYTTSGNPQIIQIDSGDKEMPFHPKNKVSPYVIELNGVGEYLLSRLPIEIMTLEDIKRLCAFIILESSELNEFVGHQIQMAIITKEDGIRMMQSGGIDEITDRVKDIDIHNMLLKCLGKK